MVTIVIIIQVGTKYYAMIDIIILKNVHTLFINYNVESVFHN